MSLESTIFGYLLEVAPVIAVMGIVIVTLYKDNKEAREYARKNDRENLETLKDLSNVLENLVENTDRTRDELSNKVHSEASKTREHLSSRIDVLTAKQSSNNRGQ